MNKQQVLQRAIQRMRRSELSRCFYLWRDRFGEVDDYARKRRKVWASNIITVYQTVSQHVTSSFLAAWVLTCHSATHHVSCRSLWHSTLIAVSQGRVDGGGPGAGGLQAPKELNIMPLELA